MERLTERELYDGKVCYTKCAATNCPDKCSMCSIPEEAAAKLKEYEDAEEQGLLLRLPCKIGQEVYVIAQEFNIKNNTSMHKIFTRHIVQIRGNKLNPIYFVTEGGDSFVPSDIGKRIFLTIEEAEAALEKLKGEEHE